MSNETALKETAQKLGIAPEWLKSLIDFESAGNPAARNAITGARGLIQFMHSTAKGMGFKDADEIVLKYPTYEKQLKTPVYNYLKKYLPFPTKQSLYMSVFYPVARTWKPETFFPPLVRKQNPGIDTVQNYIDRVEKRKIVKKTIAPAAAAIITAAVFFYLRRKQYK